MAELGVESMLSHVDLTRLEVRFCSSFEQSKVAQSRERNIGLEPCAVLCSCRARAVYFVSYTQLCPST